MYTGVRQLNPEFARKDFLEVTGIRKESGGWKRDAERDPYEMRTGIFFPRLSHSGIRGIMRLYCGSCSKINCKCKRRLGRVQYSLVKYFNTFIQVDIEKDIVARNLRIKLGKRAHNILIRRTYFIIYPIFLAPAVYSFFFLQEKAGEVFFYF